MSYRFVHANNVKIGDRFQLAGQMHEVLLNTQDVHENCVIKSQQVGGDPCIIATIIVDPNDQFTLHTNE